MTNLSINAFIRKYTVTKKKKGVIILMNLSLYKEKTLQFCFILLIYNNPPEIKMNNGIRIGWKGYVIEEQNT